MPVKCDVKEQVVTTQGTSKVSVNGKDEEVPNITGEQFVQCSKERKVIVQTSVGRVGLCPDHAKNYAELKPSDKKTYFRMRHGLIVAGPPRKAS